MKDKMTYIIAFVLTFILTTGALIYLNSYYVNIFAFDFTPANQIQQINQQADKRMQNYMHELKKYVNKNLKNELMDTIKNNIPKDKPDTMVNMALAQDTTLLDSLKNLQKEFNTLKRALAQKEKVVADSTVAKANRKAVADSSYDKWKKATAGLYESMDPRKAAKIIQSYSDDVARDLLYAMKRKKAAEILAELTPDIANRITKVK